MIFAGQCLVKPSLDPTAGEQQYECDPESDNHDPPMTGATHDADAGREPGAGGAGEPVNPKTVLGADNDACAEKADAGEDPLNDTAGSVGNFRGIAGWIGQHHDHGGGKPHQTKCAQANQLAVQIAIKTDQAAGKRGHAKTQHDLRPVMQSDFSS